MSVFFRPSLRLSLGAVLLSLSGAVICLSPVLGGTSRERELISRLRSPGSVEERLRVIDAVITSQETGIELRSALRQLSINDSSPEVRGAARFALVKLQAMAPSTTPTTAGDSPIADGRSTSPTVVLQGWNQKEKVEDVAGPMIDESVQQTKGVLSKLGEQLGIKQAVQQETIVQKETETNPPARITVVATPGPTPTSSPTTEALPPTDDVVPLKPVAPSTPPVRELPPIKQQALEKTEEARSVVEAIRKRLGQSVPQQTLEPPTAAEVAEKSAQMEPMPATEPLAQAIRPETKTPATVRPTPESFVKTDQLSTIAWPKIPPKATANSAQESTPAPPPAPTAPNAAVAPFVASPPPVASTAPGETAGPKTSIPRASGPSTANIAPTPSNQLPSSPTTVTSLKPIVPAGATPTDFEKESALAASAPTPTTKPNIELESIPEGQSGRDQLARELLERGRQLVRSGQWVEAEAVLFRVRELAVQYRWFRYSPDDLDREIAVARQKEKLAAR